MLPTLPMTPENTPPPLHSSEYFPLAGSDDPLPSMVELYDTYIIAPPNFPTKYLSNSLIVVPNVIVWFLSEEKLIT